MLNGESKNRLPEADRKGGTGSERGNERKAAIAFAADTQQS